MLGIPAACRVKISRRLGGRWHPHGVELGRQFSASPALGGFLIEPADDLRSLLPGDHGAAACTAVAVNRLYQQLSRLHLMPQHPADLETVLFCPLLIEPGLEGKEILVVFLALKKKLRALFGHKVPEDQALLQIPAQAGCILKYNDLNLLACHPADDLIEAVKIRSRAVIIHDDVHDIGQSPAMAKGKQNIPLDLNALVIDAVFVPALPAVDQRGAKVLLHHGAS